ncbi:MAG TPA: ATPase [Armatimonadota bacterium]|nr:ATPase [Armatimonadota bacterium]
MLIADCGSSWSKIRNLDDGVTAILPTQQVLRDESLRFDIATGHLGRDRTDRYENELIALARGSLKLIEDDDFTVVDIGSRDTKYVSFHGRKLRKLDWNQKCGASTGFTLELLAQYYGIDFEMLAVADKPIPVTCGIFAIEGIFEAIIKGGPAETALAAFVHGIALNVYNFAQRPKALFVSGGLCANRCFLDSLYRYCEVIPLGRNVLLEGLTE